MLRLVGSRALRNGSGFFSVACISALVNACGGVAKEPDGTGSGVSLGGSAGFPWQSGSPIAPSGPAKCKLNSECNGGLVCSFGLCHAECVSSKDCPSPQRCVKTVVGDAGSAPFGVCLLQLETLCHYRTDCQDPLVCAADLQCRNMCLVDRDCLAQELCANGVCAEANEVNPNGTLKGAVDGG